MIEILVSSFILIFDGRYLSFEVFGSWSDFEVQVIELSYLRDQYHGFLGQNQGNLWG
jgi:hypothetical protein